MMRGHQLKRLVLIENGILKNFMQDRLNARLMNTRSTGSGRRENYRHIVLAKNEKYHDVRWQAILSRRDD